MKLCLDLAKKSAEEGEMPVGAVIVRESDGVIIGRGRNRRESKKNALCHAEISAIDAACGKTGGWRLSGCVIYVTLEPCVMCAGAIINARIDKTVFGASDNGGGKLSGEEILLADGKRVFGGVMKNECEGILNDFFGKLRSRNKREGSVRLIPVLTRGQIKEVSGLAFGIWRECYKKIISEGQIEYMLEKFQSEEAVCSQIKNDGYRYFFINRNSARAGYAAVRNDEDGRLFLSKIYLKKEHRGQGLSEQIFSRLKEICRNEGLTAIWLTVNRNNSAAVSAYKKAGFKIIGETVSDIGGGYVMDDFLFQLDI
jgi:tRNA(Arg) A34 adenosine deaminase TadA/ribosomal protein S18 acetylase RimI-like enzyme